MDRTVAKQRTKQLVRRLIGEPYVGKRLKLQRMNHALSRLDLRPHDILDAGSEDATFVYWLADRYPTAAVTAIDIDTAAIEACRKARPAAYSQRVSFRTSTFAQLDAESFDLITAFDVLEHIVDDRAAAADLTRALRPHGTLLVHVPRDRWTTWSGEVERIADEDAWQVNAGHVRAGYSPESLADVLQSAGLRVAQLETWVGRWGALAYATYTRLEHPTVLRLLSIPVTDVCGLIDMRSDQPDGNTVFVRAIKPAA